MLLLISCLLFTNQLRFDALMNLNSFRDRHFVQAVRAQDRHYVARLKSSSAILYQHKQNTFKPIHLHLSHSFSLFFFLGHTLMLTKAASPINDENSNLEAFCQCLEKIFQKGLITQHNALGFYKSPESWDWLRKVGCKRYNFFLEEYFVFYLSNN